MRTVTMSGQTSVTTLENGLHYVQSTPDNLVVGQVEPFVGRGKIQMLSNGQLEVTQTRHVRKKPEYRGEDVAMLLAFLSGHFTGKKGKKA